MDEKHQGAAGIVTKAGRGAVEPASLPFHFFNASKEKAIITDGIQQDEDPGKTGYRVKNLIQEKLTK